MIKFAVISFPGTNCEAENVRGFKRNGMNAETVLWNDPGLLDGSRCAEFDGYCIAGGFSYEDRGRSGVVAAQDPIMSVIRKESDNGKVVLGICNGAQILIETGLVPGFKDHSLAMALAWNEMRVGDTIVDTGFYNAWCYLKNSAPRGRSAFNDFDETLHVPFAHGEGRFIMDSSILEKLEEAGQIVFKYCDPSGIVSSEFPITPNGAMGAAAAICNPSGNVMAIMPHPERDPFGGGDLIFQSVKRWIESSKNSPHSDLGEYLVSDDTQTLETVDLEVLVRLVITDNTERTIEEAFIRNGVKANLDRYEYYGIQLQSNTSIEEAIVRIMATGELANFNKHLVFVRTREGIFTYNPQYGLLPKSMSLDQALVAFDRQDFVGQSKMTAINLHAGPLIKSLRYGTFWKIKGGEEGLEQKIIASKILHNPNSMVLAKA